MFPALRVTAKLISSHVVKKLKPGQPGTLRWAEQFGEKMLCVRYRLDESGNTRYTTVEILVDEREVRKPKSTVPDRMVFLKILVSERGLQQQIKDAGGKWDPKEYLWVLPYSKAKALKLLPRIVKNVQI